MDKRDFVRFELEMSFGRISYIAQDPRIQLHQPRLWFFTGGYLVKRWFIPAAARARGQSYDLNREILASNLFNCHKEVINAPPVPSISRSIHIVYRHKNVWEYQWSNFIYNCMSTFLHYVHCKDALLDCSAPGGERCESLTWVNEIRPSVTFRRNFVWKSSFLQENPLENVVCKMAAICHWPQYGHIIFFGRCWNKID